VTSSAAVVGNKRDSQIKPSHCGNEAGATEMTQHRIAEGAEGTDGFPTHQNTRSVWLDGVCMKTERVAAYPVHVLLLSVGRARCTRPSDTMSSVQLAWIVPWPR